MSRMFVRISSLRFHVRVVSYPGPMCDISSMMIWKRLLISRRGSIKWATASEYPEKIVKIANSVAKEPY